MDDVYRSIVHKAMKKGWNPDPKIDDIKWIVQEGSFFTKVAVWNGTEMEEKMGACSIERVLFEHRFASIMWGDNFLDILKNLVSLDTIERVEFLSQYIDEEDIITNV